MSSPLFASVLARLKLLTGSETDVQLARALAVSPQTLSSWKVRGSIPYALCIDIARQRGCSLDWLLLGEYQDGPSGLANETWESDMLARLRALSVADRQAIQLQIEDKQRIHQLERQVRELTLRMPTPIEG
ncbi:helix-turn-helix domain-containing protein [Pseudomonas sp. Rh2]|uniref:Helix-turn-helix domain-containing protein n=1 Tax=Pseudomonas taiwanensis TaxID=470150 RepID=A0ABR6V131_9PSED|nr:MULTISPECIES: helix-turn-helix domain-containing protein [Pseudomonas]MBC3474129.1 helix-turn-helix domain-containing protein [Pseudomonas taiwanensis]MBC3492282.1 helix-turn-helix domain-containing protein [Pseudomonas taiwanensis]MDT8924096.1 helix-turn-helix domain-containing protein [Pseudomonas taiwanensis]MPT01091.1 transcriptional regulator [Pseudomonas sp.]WEZ86998.1 helix-turn-helix domain-containing protein [Pseudomonas sp. NyZ480]